MMMSLAADANSLRLGDSSSVPSGGTNASPPLDARRNGVGSIETCGSASDRMFRRIFFWNSATTTGDDAFFFRASEKKRKRLAADASSPRQNLFFFSTQVGLERRGKPLRGWEEAQAQGSRRRIEAQGSSNKKREPKSKKEGAS